jgi:hypothetical protein
LALKASVTPVVVVIGTGITLLAWMCLFSWAIYRSVYNDHHNLAGRLRAVVNEKDALKHGLQVRDEYIKQLEEEKKNKPKASVAEDLASQLGKIFPDQRARISINNLHFVRTTVNMPDGDKPIVMPFPMQGTSIDAKIEYQNRGDMDAIEVEWFVRVFISEQLDAATEDQQYAAMMRTARPKQPSLRRGEIGYMVLKSDLVTANDQQAVRMTTKDIYVFVATKFRDKLGPSSSEYCSRYVYPQWNIDVGCHGHNK